MATESYIVQMQLERYEIFKAHEPANFDVTFEVDGKLIYANKFFLETISTTFKSMLSERWKSKDDIIKLDTYSYDSFYRFLTFIYSGNCALTDASISTMVDMSEFYDVAAFKDFCDEYVCGMKYSMKNILNLMELVTKYSLPWSKRQIDDFTVKEFSNILTAVKLQKSSIETFLKFKRGRGHEELLFEAIYKWAENQVMTETTGRKRKLNDTNEASIKAVMDEFLPHIKFDRMNPNFFSRFVVSRGYLFTYEELSAILYEQQKITVTVKDNNGRCLIGSFVETFNVYDSIKAIMAQLNRGHIDQNQWFCYEKPPTPSDIKKNENAQFYLVLADDQLLKIKKPADIIDSDYLICEMKIYHAEFEVRSWLRIYVSRNYFVV